MRMIKTVATSVLHYAILAIGVPLLIAGAVFCTLSESFDRRC